MLASRLNLLSYDESTDISLNVGEKRLITERYPGIHPVAFIVSRLKLLESQAERLMKEKKRLTWMTNQSSG
jgi:hypothetical protein